MSPSDELCALPLPPGPGVPVELNVYDLQHPDSPDAVSTLNGYLYTFGVGLYHSSVCVYGVEYAYGGHADAHTGVFTTRPKQAPGARFRQTLLIGFTRLTPDQVKELVHAMSAVWGGNTYNLLTRNCNHFASDLCERLTGKCAPEWVNRMAWLGEKAKFLLPKGFDTPTAAPVTAPVAAPVTAPVRAPRAREAQQLRQLMQGAHSDEEEYESENRTDPDHDQ